ncbi:Uu.00g134860.m01.CDS01 [Anthostomella pinea]|uniref:Uu.00g134860.m01.CDS01 n=1 Tax=Anthostomella pinea TaxID=933095 RepID=A0AAI8YIG0_9PEZI|nr:Uu.00g134860.m01.CDS01 [Anthostomella pinea]
MAMPRSMINTWLSLTDEKENHSEQPASCPSPPRSRPSLRKPTKRKAFASIDLNMSEPSATRRRGKGKGRYDVAHHRPPHHTDISLNLTERILLEEERVDAKAQTEREAQAEAERTPRPTTRSRRIPPEAAAAEGGGGGGGETGQDGSPRRRTTRTSRRPNKHGEPQPGQEQDPEREAEPPSSTSRFANRIWADALSSRVPLPLPSSSSAGADADRADVFSSPSRSSASTGRSTGRARSPVKSMADLRLSLKPPQTLSFDLGPPDDVEELYQTLVQINDGEGLIPAAAKARFERPKRPVKEWQIDNSPVAEADRVILEREIDLAEDLSAMANCCFSEGHSEASWNSQVHTPLLKLALWRVPTVRYFNITSAAPCFEFLPRLERGGDLLQSKFVDYSMNLDLDVGEMMTDIMRRQPPACRTLAPTMYAPVRSRPQAVAIETKVANAASDPLVQLTIWAAASFERLRQLQAPAQTGGGNGDNDALEVESIITLPLIQVRGHDWHLWFARDSPHNIDLHGPLLIGSTATLLGTFKLVRSLRALAWWVATRFRPWFESVILGREVDVDVGT